MAQTLLRTPLHDRHVALGARMVPFAGWEMPVQYEGVIQEHRAVRADAGVFDVSHMGEIEVEGPRAPELLQALLSNDLDRLEPGEAQYTLLTNERGGIVDDLIVYRLDEFRYLLVVNASNREADFAWIKEREITGSDVRDVSDEYALLAVQGPHAIEKLGLAAGAGVHVRRGDDRRRRVHGQPHRLHRRGRLRDPLHGRGRRRALGRRARARRHAVRARRARHAAPRGRCRCTATTSGPRRTRSRPGSAGRARSTTRSSPASTSLRRIKEDGPERKLVAFVMEEKAIPRQGMPIEGGGEVTSGTHSPMLDVGIGMGYVPAAQAQPRHRADHRRPRQAAPRAHREETDLQEGGLSWPPRSRIPTT